MLKDPMEGERIFEVSVYNKLVRFLVKENQSHDIFDDHWADLRIQNLVARDENEARRIICERFPESDGFVIEAVRLTSI